MLSIKLEIKQIEEKEKESMNDELAAEFERLKVEEQALLETNQTLDEKFAQIVEEGFTLSAKIQRKEAEVSPKESQELSRF